MLGYSGVGLPLIPALVLLASGHNKSNRTFVQLTTYWGKPYSIHNTPYRGSNLERITLLHSKQRTFKVEIGNFEIVIRRVDWMVLAISSCLLYTGTQHDGSKCMCTTHHHFNASAAKVFRGCRDLCRRLRSFFGLFLGVENAVMFSLL